MRVNDVTASELGEGVAWLCAADPGVAALLRAHLAATAARFSWDRAAEAHERLYAEAL